MKRYIAIGKNGKNIKFNTQSEIMAFFRLKHTDKINNLVYSGESIQDPKTKEEYFIDELEDGSK